MGSTPWLGCSTPIEHRLRPRGFSPPRRLAHTLASGLVASRYRTGFAAFRAGATLYERGPTSAVPSSAFTPFEAFPSLAAVPRHRGRCLLDRRATARPKTTGACSSHALPRAPTSAPAAIAGTESPADRHHIRRTAVTGDTSAARIHTLATRASLRVSSAEDRDLCVTAAEAACPPVPCHPPTGEVGAPHAPGESSRRGCRRRAAAGCPATARASTASREPAHAASELPRRVVPGGVPSGRTSRNWRASAASVRRPCVRWSLSAVVSCCCQHIPDRFAARSSNPRRPLRRGGESREPTARGWRAISSLCCPEALLHQRVRCSGAPLPEPPSPLLPWAWFPLQDSGALSLVPTLTCRSDPASASRQPVHAPTVPCEGVCPRGSVAAAEAAAVLLGLSTSKSGPDLLAGASLSSVSPVSRMSRWTSAGTVPTLPNGRTCIILRLNEKYVTQAG